MDLNPQIDLFSHSYHNTTDSKGKELDIYEGKAKAIEKKVYELFLANPDTGMNWSEVMAKMGKVNESSLKRSLTNLKNRFLLIKTSEMVLSSEGAPAHRYKLNK